MTHIPLGGSEFGLEQEADTWAYVRNDPTFACMFVRSFYDMGLNLPDEIHEPELWQLYNFKRYRDIEIDPDVLEACALTNPRQRVIRTMIECMLMHPKIKFEWIAESTGYTINTIRLFHELFFNMRDRITNNLDPAYLLSIIFPDSRQAQFTYNYHLNEGWVAIARRIAYISGIKEMFKWLGGQPDDSELTGVESMRAIESRFASAGRFAMTCGFQNQPVVAISGARALLQSSKLGGQSVSDDDATMGLTRLSYDQGAMFVFKKLVTAEAHERLRSDMVFETPISQAAATVTPPEP